MIETMEFIFVGIHNKRGYKPLDPKTHSGAIIDNLQRQLNALGHTVRRTNLCDLERMPETEWEARKECIGYWDRVEYKPAESVFVLLGGWVHTHFIRMPDTPIVKLPHPASFAGRNNRLTYCQDAMSRISKILENAN